MNDTGPAPAVHKKLGQLYPYFHYMLSKQRITLFTPLNSDIWILSDRKALLELKSFFIFFTFTKHLPGFISGLSLVPATRILVYPKWILAQKDHQEQPL